MVAPNRGRRSSYTFYAVAIGVAVIVASAVVVGIPELTNPVTTCSLGREIGSASIWTPGILVNVPFLGSAAFSSNQIEWIFSSGSLQVGATPRDGGGGLSPGPPEFGINGFFGLANWSFFEAQNHSQAFGTGTPCTQPYVAEITSALSCGALGNLSTILVLPNNVSDAVQPHTIPLSYSCNQGMTPSPGASIWFDTSYHVGGTSGSGASESLRLCGFPYTAPLNVSLWGPASYPIVVSMLADGQTIRATGNFVWSDSNPHASPAAEYSLPNGWVWNVSTVGPGTLPTPSNPSTTSLLAFERSSC